MEKQGKALNPEQMKLMRSQYLKQMKDDVGVLELDARFWEAKFKALYYKDQFAKMEAQIQDELAAFQAMSEKMKEQVLDQQEDMPKEESAPVEN